MLDQFYKIRIDLMSDNIYLYGGNIYTLDPVMTNDKHVERIVTILWYSISLGFLVLCVVLVVLVVGNGQMTKYVGYDTPPLAALFLYH